MKHEYERNQQTPDNTNPTVQFLYWVLLSTSLLISLVMDMIIHLCAWPTSSARQIYSTVHLVQPKIYSLFLVNLREYAYSCTLSSVVDLKSTLWYPVSPIRVKLFYGVGLILISVFFTLYGDQIFVILSTDSTLVCSIIPRRLHYM